MNIKAFDISNNINEKEFYPENYILDNTLDKDIQIFFQSQKNIENIFPKKQSQKETNNIIQSNNLLENEDNMEEEEEEDSSESSELIYSSFPDNITKAKNQIYENMHIEANIIKVL